MCISYTIVIFFQGIIKTPRFFEGKSLETSC
jgi:hypothetical protein